MSKHDTPATGNQMSLIFKLMGERQCNKLEPEQALYLARLTEGAFTITQNAASKIIDALFELPKKKPALHFNVELEAGMYKHGDVIYKVQKAVHGSGNMYAKKLCYFDPDGHEAKVAGDGGSWQFVYQQGAINTLSPEDKMSLEDAKEFGRIYGVCIRCGATLTDEDSIEAGIGPICATKF